MPARENAPPPGVVASTRGFINPSEKKKKKRNCCDPASSPSGRHERRPQSPRRCPLFPPPHHCWIAPPGGLCRRNERSGDLLVASGHCCYPWRQWRRRWVGTPDPVPWWPDPVSLRPDPRDASSGGGQRQWWRCDGPQATGHRRACARNISGEVAKRADLILSSNDASSHVPTC